MMPDGIVEDGEFGKKFSLLNTQKGNIKTLLLK